MAEALENRQRRILESIGNLEAQLEATSAKTPIMTSTKKTPKFMRLLGAEEVQSRGRQVARGLALENGNAYRVVKARCDDEVRIGILCREDDIFLMSQCCIAWVFRSSDSCSDLCS